MGAFTKEIPKRKMVSQMNGDVERKQTHQENEMFDKNINQRFL